MNFAGSVRQPIYHSARRSGGFTLLEIMVVVLIIGIITTFATLSMGDRALDDRMEAEAHRLEQLLSLAEDDAQSKGIEIGFRQTATGYQFLATAKDGKWASYAQSGPLRDRTLPDPFYMQLTVEGHALPSPAAQGDAKDTKIEPQILLLSSGEATAFSIVLGAQGYRPFYRISGDVLGNLKIVREGDPQ